MRSERPSGYLAAGGGQASRDPKALAPYVRIVDSCDHRDLPADAPPLPADAPAAARRTRRRRGRPGRARRPGRHPQPTPAPLDDRLDDRHDDASRVVRGPREVTPCRGTRWPADRAPDDRGHRMSRGKYRRRRRGRDDPTRAAAVAALHAAIAEEDHQLAGARAAPPWSLPPSPASRARPSWPPAAWRVRRPTPARPRTAPRSRGSTYAPRCSSCAASTTGSPGSTPRRRGEPRPRAPTTPAPPGSGSAHPTCTPGPARLPAALVSHHARRGTTRKRAHPAGLSSRAHPHRPRIAGPLAPGHPARHGRRGRLELGGPTLAAPTRRRRRAPGSAPPSAPPPPGAPTPPNGLTTGRRCPPTRRSPCPGDPAP